MSDCAARQLVPAVGRALCFTPVGPLRAIAASARLWDKTKNRPTGLILEMDLYSRFYGIQFPAVKIEESKLYKLSKN